MLLPDSPAPWSNTAARYFGPVLRTMDTLGHSITVVAPIRNQTQLHEAEEYLLGTQVRLRCFPAPSPKPMVERKIRSVIRSGWELTKSEFGDAVRRELERSYDVVLAEMAETARVVEEDPRTVLSLHHLRYIDLAGAPTGGIKSQIERLQARRSELSTCRRVSRIRTTSERLRNLLSREGVNTDSVVPICVDSSLYERVGSPSVPTIGVLGSMFWWPSRLAAKHFVERIAPRLKAARPNVRLLVGGWQAHKFLTPYLRDDSIELLDCFPDPRDAFSRLSVLVYAPPVGTGMKVKVLEAMAYGVPVVANSEGYEGLEVDATAPVRLAVTDDEIVDNVLALLDDERNRQRVIHEGIACVQRSFSPEKVAGQLVDFFQQKKGLWNA